MSQLYPASVRRLIEEFNKLPGIGARSAERLAFHILATPRDVALGLATAIHDVKTALRACSRCFNVADTDICHICADSTRDRETLCVVELPRDVIVIEKCGAYHGLYHVLQGHLDPLNHVEPENLRIAELWKRVAQEKIREVILALNPTSAGDATAQYIAEILRQKYPAVRLTTLARGLSSGAEIETSAPSSLVAALNERQKMA